MFRCYLNKWNNRDDGMDTQKVYPWLKLTLIERDCSGIHLDLHLTFIEFPY